MRACRCPPSPAQVTVLAADGSQINPDRHARVEFCVINVGAFEMSPGPAAAPREIIQSKLLDQEELYTAHGLVSEEIVALMRDLNERRFLADLACAAAPPVVSLTDGPLELFRARDTKELEDFQRIFGEYTAVLTRLAEIGVITAGYVDKPASDLVVRLLELARLPAADLKQAGRRRSWLGVTDASLFRELLDPGERSAVFKIQSTSAASFKGALALHFFYLNVGRPDHPWIVRVEIPAWVAADPGCVELLHATVVYQSQLLGARPYPYALHRAHEVAVVSLAEKDQLEQMMIAEMLAHGLAPGEKSNKQTAKDLQGRTRYRS